MSARHVSSLAETIKGAAGRSWRENGWRAQGRGDKERERWWGDKERERWWWGAGGMVSRGASFEAACTSTIGI